MARKFGMIPYDQLQQIRGEKPSVMRLWCECWATDPYGSRFMLLETQLTDKTLKVAKARLRALKYFEFKSEVTIESGGQRVWRMFVLNLQGSKSQTFNKDRPDQSDYQKFLESDYWKSIRRWIIERDNNCCQSCGTKYHLQVHHLTYEHHGYEHEHPEDLITLCQGCHQEAHNRS